MAGHMGKRNGSNRAKDNNVYSSHQLSKGEYILYRHFVQE